METKAELLYPYNEEEKTEFIVLNNHKLGYEIKETETGLQALGYTKEEIEEQEKERIAHLHLTKREVFLGLHKAKQVTPDMIKAQITNEEALIEFEYATEYYRGNPLIDMVGEALGITPKQLDRFFETNDYKELLDENPTNEPTIIPDETTITTNQGK